MFIAGGAIATTSSVPLSPLLHQWTAEFRYDAVRMEVVSTEPSAGALLPINGGQATVRIHLNDLFDSASLGTDDFAPFDGTVLSAAAIDADTVEFTLMLDEEGPVALTIPAGALTDGFGNPMVAFNGTYLRDWSTITLADWAPTQPVGSLVYETGVAAFVTEPGDTDSFEFALEAGGAISIVGHQTSDLQPRIELFNPANVSVATAAGTGGADAVLQGIPIANSGTYRIVVSGLNGSAGAYDLRVLLSAGLEVETHGGATNDSIATAQNLDEAFLSIGGVDRATILGQADGFEMAQAVTTSYNGTGDLRTPSPGTVNATLTIADSYRIADINVRLDITHRDISDYRASLLSPQKTVFLFDNVGGEDANNFTGTVLDDEAAIGIYEGAAPFTGSFRPMGLLSQFDGDTMNGVWTLRLEDPWSNDGGRLNSWGIDITHAPESLDYYAVTLAAGERATVTLTNLTGGRTELELQNAAGTVLATAVGGSTNVNAVIDAFTAPQSSLYYVKIRGDAGVNYGLTVLRHAVFDLGRSLDLASAQNLSGQETVVGALATPDPVFVTQNSGGLGGSFDLTFGTDGDLYVTGFSTTNGNIVGRYDGVGGYFEGVFANGSPNGQGLTFGPNGDLYVADGNSAVHRFSGTTGAHMGIFASRSLLEGPRTPRFGPDGNLYVTNIVSDAVTRFNGQTGAFIDEFVTRGSGGLDFPWGLAFGPDNTGDGAAELYVASLRTNNILRYNGATGAFLGVFVPGGSGGLANPNMLTFGPDTSGDGVQDLYVAAGNVLRYDGLTGAFIDTFVDGAGAGTLTFGPDGSLYVGSGTGVSRYHTPLRDTYKLSLVAGAQLTLATATPLGSLNTLDPQLRFYDPAGTLVASDDNSAADGRNALLTHAATTSGTYYIQIVPSPTEPSSTGEYVLSLDVYVPPALAVNDVALAEGNSGTTAFTFHVTRSGDTSGAVTVDFATANGIATLANNDYTFTSGTLTFAIGETTKTVTVLVNGDSSSESNETFTLNLFNASPGAVITDNQGVGTILDDEVKFKVVDDATSDKTYQYSSIGTPAGSSALAAGNTGPRGAASNAAGDRFWVVDANRNVYVYNAAGGLLGSWAAGGLAANSTPEGIATNGVDVWIVDSKSDKVFRYTGAASRLSGSQTAASSFALNGSNKDPKGIVTDGTSLWVVNASTTDKVFQYTLGGALVGSWTIDAANASPTGITLDPNNVGHLWIVDNGTDRVYQYDNAVSRTSGSQSASTSFALAAGNTNPQDIADPPAPGTTATAGSPIEPAGRTGKFSRLWRPDRWSIDVTATLASANEFRDRLKVLPHELLALGQPESADTKVADGSAAVRPAHWNLADVIDSLFADSDAIDRFWRKAHTHRGRRG
jgi:subtilisin-like proprotein convertase family protein